MPEPTIMTRQKAQQIYDEASKAFDAKEAVAPTLYIYNETEVKAYKKALT